MVNCSQNDEVTPMAGYLSLHQDYDKLTIKWTPNQLMNGGNGGEEIVDKRWNCHQMPLTETLGTLCWLSL